ncbi:putative cationic amino acid transporter 6, chloroplastic isoform X1 [Iris pallida]|uniref:Cationic amino acid transporter 6, chloroplastic isoform X1 n=1 Tax=Iris pallida TaxID=29817 RepID=A0AAX6ICA5_IRIPA|nr:putative cationic amino acid transporter 6, chloroplastic isoform X1 [Iris pallida]
MVLCPTCVCWTTYKNLFQYRQEFYFLPIRCVWIMRRIIGVHPAGIETRNFRVVFVSVKEFACRIRVCAA